MSDWAEKVYQDSLKETPRSVPEKVFCRFCLGLFPKNETQPYFSGRICDMCEDAFVEQEYPVVEEPEDRED